MPDENRHNRSYNSRNDHGGQRKTSPDHMGKHPFTGSRAGNREKYQSQPSPTTAREMQAAEAARLAAEKAARVKGKPTSAAQEAMNVGLGKPVSRRGMMGVNGVPSTKKDSCAVLMFYMLIGFVALITGICSLF